MFHFLCLIFSVLFHEACFELHSVAYSLEKLTGILVDICCFILCKNSNKSYGWCRLKLRSSNSCSHLFSKCKEFSGRIFM